MAGQAAGLIAVALMGLAASAALAADPDKLKTPQVPWSTLSPEERRILEPVAPEWPRMPGYQQQRLKGAAKKYPEMQPIQKERFESRLKPRIVAGELRTRRCPVARHRRHEAGSCLQAALWLSPHGSNVIVKNPHVKLVYSWWTAVLGRNR